MRIVSPFKDYYDGLQSMGHDEKLIYVRKSEERETPDRWRLRKLHNWSLPKGKNHQSYSAYDFWILFCGKMYHGICLVHTTDNWEKPHKEYHYSKESLAQAFERHGLGEIPSSRKQMYLLRHRMNLADRIETLGEESPSGLTEWMIQEKIPVASSLPTIAGDHPMLVNPSLKEYEFFRVFDHMSTFQALSMWLGGVQSRAENDIISICDSDRLKQHGFDKYSFRKMPNNPKKQ